MMQPARQLDTKPWYRQFWPWVLIGIPAASVAGSMLMIHLAISGHDGVVREFYQKDGRGILENTAPDQLALDMGLGATIRFDPETGDVSVKLSGQDAQHTIQTLDLLLVHPTRARLDQIIPLRHLRDGHYVGQVLEAPAGRRQLQLMPPDQSWRLKQGRVYFPLVAPLELHAATGP